MPTKAQQQCKIYQTLDMADHRKDIYATCVDFMDEHIMWAEGIDDQTAKKQAQEMKDRCARLHKKFSIIYQENEERAIRKWGEFWFEEAEQACKQQVVDLLVP